MRSEIRSAAIGGLAATFVMAAAFAPKLLSHPSEETFHQTAAVAPATENSTASSDPVASTVTTEAYIPATTTTGPGAAVTTTTAAPTTTSTTAHVTTSSSTTTTTAPSLPIPVLAIDTMNGTISWAPVADATGYRFSFDHGDSQVVAACCTITMPPYQGGWRLPWTEVWAVSTTGAQSPHALLTGTGSPEGERYHCDPDSGRCVAYPAS